MYFTHKNYFQSITINKIIDQIYLSEGIPTNNMQLQAIATWVFADILKLKRRNVKIFLFGTVIRV